MSYEKALSLISGGGASLKTLNIQNVGNTELTFYNVVVDGKIDSVSIAPAATEAVQYVEPATGQTTFLQCSSALTITTGATGIEATLGQEIAISDTAEDGATIALRAGGLG